MTTAITEIKKNEKFILDEDLFDLKVATSIVSIHLKMNKKWKKKKFKEWSMKNIDDLENLYQLSGLESSKVDFGMFCNYVFKNSYKFGSVLKPNLVI